VRNGRALVAAFGAVLVFSTNAFGGVPGLVTRVVKNVSVVSPGGASHSAAPNESVGSGATVRTGPDARAEVTFADSAVTRLGGKTALRLGDELILDEGAVLFDAPRRASSATIRTGTINVEGAGATGIIERFGRVYAKVMVLQGTARIFLPEKVGESILLKAGQILIMKPDAKGLAEPVDYNIAHLYKTSLLVHHEFARLPGEPQILAEIAKQQSDPNLIPTNLVIHGRGTLVTLENSGKVASKPKAAASPTPTPRPSPRR
jgi:FecR-like protein